MFALLPHLQSSAVQGFSLEAFLLVLFAMGIGHAIADFPLQGEFIAIRKSILYQPAKDDPLNREKGVWLICILAHSLIHAGMVWLISGLWILAFSEVLLHAVIDHFRCLKKYSFVTDQVLHILCKTIYALIIAAGIL